VTSKRRSVTHWRRVISSATQLRKFQHPQHFQLNILESRTGSCFTFQTLHAPNVIWTLPSAQNGENRSGQTGSPSSSCLKLSTEPSLTDAWSWRTDIALMSHSRVGDEGPGQIWTLTMEIIMIQKHKWGSDPNQYAASQPRITGVAGTDLLIVSNQKENDKAMSKWWKSYQYLGHVHVFFIWV